MSRQMLIHIPQLTGALRETIRTCARQRSFNAIICDDAEAAKAFAREAEIIFSSDASLIDCAPKLRWLCVPSAGAEQYLKPVLEDRRGVLLSNSSGAYGTTIAEHVVMVTLCLMRRLLDYDALIRQRVWKRDLPVRSIRDSRITLLGTGDIGREAAIRLRAFSPRSIIGLSRRGLQQKGIFDAVYSIDRLDDILPETDLLIISLPDTPHTQGLMDARRLQLLPEDAFIVNVGRGSALDQVALNDMLTNGRLGGAALDVFTEEPLPKDDLLWDCPRLLITPHTAGNMTLPYTVQRIVELFLEDFERYCDELPLLRGIQRDKGY